MAEWWMRRAFGPRGRWALVNGLTMGIVVWIIWLIARPGFAWGPVIISAGSGLGAALGSLSGRKQMLAAFPPMTLLEEKVKAWRIVRDGGPVDNAADARVVAHYAQWILRRPSAVTVFLVWFAGIAITLGLSLLIIDVDPEYARVGAIATVLCLAYFPIILRIPKQRENAERALTASRAAMPAPPTGSGSAPPGSPAGG